MNTIAEVTVQNAAEDVGETVAHQQVLELTSLELALVGGGQASMAFY